MAGPPKSKTLPMPDLGRADPDFYADNPTASRGTPEDDGNISDEADFGVTPPKPNPSGNGPFKNLKSGK